VGRNNHDCLHYCLPGVPDVYNGRLMAILGEVGGGMGGKRMGAAADGADGSRPPNSFNAPGTVLRRFNFRYGDLPFVEVAKLPPPHEVHPAEARAGRAHPYTSLSLRLDPSSSAAMLVECPALGTANGVQHAQGNGSLGACSDLERFSGV
jgi:hypothetical protein